MDSGSGRGRLGGARGALVGPESDHAVELVEFPAVLERVAARAATPMGRERVRRLRPATEVGRVRAELSRVADAVAFVRGKPEWALPSFPDAAAELDAAAMEGAVLDGPALHRVGRLLEAARRVAEEFASREELPESLSVLARRLVADTKLEADIGRSVDGEGQVLDTASRELARIRASLRGAHQRIVRRLEAYLSTLDERYRVPDASVTIREGRYVVPVRREGRRDVGGIVHDESHTGATLFIEPPVALELMARLRDLERDEAREVRRVLGALTARIGPRARELAGSLDALVDLDALLARARTAQAWDAWVPDVVDASEPGATLRVRGARHPLLLETQPAASVIPYDVELEAGERAVVVSGPNTGGKSVFLKAMGLLPMLAQAGVAPPVGRGSRLPVFRAFFADIGDEQSISRSLSTFAAHLSNLAEILNGADRAALVLADEMGTGTDPAEGGALARAVLETLVERGALTFASSHLGALKRLDTPDSGIVNASLEFDSERMAPTYRFVKGRPGRSYGLAIARTLGFPTDLLDRAEAYLEDADARLDVLLERLERREAEAARTLARLEEATARVEEKEAELAERERRLAEAEATADERARERARRELMEARAEVERAIDELRRTAHPSAAREAERRARRRVEEAAGRRAPPAGGRGRARGRPGPAPGPGDRVRLRRTGARGVVVEVRGDRALVEAGALRMEVPVAELEGAGGGSPDRERARRAAQEPVRGGWSAPEAQARPEVDLRGLRVDEVDLPLRRALDDAVREDLSELRIIHGKGTGALRARVAEVLGGDGRVESHRPGGPGEGGAGVTVVRLR